MLTHLERFLMPAHVGPAQPSQAVAQAARQSGGTAEPDLGGMSRGRIQRQLRRVQPLSPGRVMDVQLDRGQGRAAFPQRGGEGIGGRVAQ